MERDLSTFEEKIGLKFKNKNLLRQVFVHRSYLNENIGFDLDHNERLEFLGDAILEFLITEYLYKNYPNPEGELTSWRSALVKGKTLSDLAQSLSMNEYLLLSRGEAHSSGKARELILANAYEALIGALYLDQGLEVTRNFVEKQFIILLPNILSKGLHRDPKSLLQEIFQAQEKITPVYKVMKESGPDHAKKFTIGVFAENRLLAEGEGLSKQAAQRDSAQKALKKLGYLKESS